jgi:glycosyltransferase involved in cell wall biosynthesis
MRILFITPYPPSTYRVRSYGLLRQLHQRHNVTVAVICRSDREVADAQALSNQGYEVVMVQEPQWRARLRSAWALIRRDSLHTAYARSALFADALSNICTLHRFDVVHVEHLRGMVAASSLAHTLPMVWDAVDCISLLYKQTAISGPNLPWRLLASMEYQRIQRYEASMLQVAQHIIVTSERDRQALLNLLPIPGTSHSGEECRTQPLISVLPNGVQSFRSVSQARRRFNIVFSGKMNYHPNQAAALYLYEQIMPLIWQQQPQATLTLAGGDPPDSIRRLAKDTRVEVTGFVADLRLFIQQAEVMLCPMLYGTGIQNKVLEAMALETPVVASPLAVAALHVQPGRELLVARSPQEFAKATLLLLEDTHLRDTLIEQGREYIERYHDWQGVTEQLISIYQQAITVHKQEVGQLSSVFHRIPVTEP